MLDISNYKDIKVISFDIFDTAFFRETFRPKDIFDILENKYKNNFKELRMKAESIAREKFEGECTLGDVYKILPEITDIFKNEIENIKKDEISLELKHIRQNKEIFDFYTSVKDSYKIIYTSDMYLSRELIMSMLKKTGYEEHPLYLSGELGINKSNGKLYDYILDDLNIKPHELLHIGDNYRSDILVASQKGINTYYCINNYDQSFANESISNKKIISLYNHSDYSTSFLVKLLTEKENSQADIYNKIGFYWGIIFYNFVKWVVDESNGKKIFFNSRDGFLPYKIAKCLMGVNCDYVYLSRRSTSFVAFDTDYPINHDKNLYFYNAFRFQRVNNIKQLLSCIGMDSCTVSEKIKKAGFFGEEDNIEPFKFNGEEIHKKLQNLILSIEPEIYGICASKRQNLMNYIQSLDMKDGDIFCDIGYNGSIQYGIEILTGLKLEGKYFEVYNRAVKLDCNKEGYLSTGENLTYGYGSLMETLFSAPHGGVVGYENCEPLLFEDSSVRINILNKIHNGIFEFCVKWNELNKNIELDIDKEIVKTMVMRFLKEPSLEEAQYGLEIPFDNGAEDALENITWFNQDRIRNGRILECYSRSYWKEAFIKILNNSQYAGLSKFL